MITRLSLFAFLFCCVLLPASSPVFAFGPRNVPVPYVMKTSITVTALQDLLADRVLVSKAKLEANPSLTTDGALRYVPAFSLFRRSGSRTANPTTQGVALRGIGASGASRAVVLLDGVPVNDPFGGWVYWNRVPVHALESIEISRGGTSDIFGADALSGAIHFKRADVSQPYAAFDAIRGNQQTSQGSVALRQELDTDLFVGAAGQYFHSNGDFLIEEHNRGTVDTRAGAEQVSAEVHLQRNLPAGRLFVTNSYYSEARKNGTVLQTNQTVLWQIAAGGEWYDVSQGEMSFHIYGGGQSYHQTFSAISGDRNAEFLTRDQRVPSQHFGLMLFWRRALAESQLLSTGVTLRQVEGESQESIPATASFVFQGGQERLAGWFLQDRISVSSRVTLTIGSRLDRWKKMDGHSRTVDAAGLQMEEEFQDAGQWQWSPRILIQYQLKNALQITASAYRSFRPPTLNELYRAFRIGNILTLANTALIPEKLTGAETGFRYARNYMTFNANVFWAKIDDPVTNLTLETTPDLILRQRSNVGNTTTTGLEMETHLLTGFGEFELAYQLAHSTFGEATEESIEGNFLPQVPLHSGSVSYRTILPGKIEMHARARVASRSYDDDRNDLILPAYWVADLFLSKPLTSRFALLFAIENLFNRRIVISKTPIETVGTSTLITAGLRFRM